MRYESKIKKKKKKNNGNEKYLSRKKIEELIRIDNDYLASAHTYLTYTRICSGQMT